MVKFSKLLISGVIVCVFFVCVFVHVCDKYGLCSGTDLCG